MCVCVCVFFLLFFYLLVNKVDHMLVLPYYMVNKNELNNHHNTVVTADLSALAYTCIGHIIINTIIKIIYSVSQTPQTFCDIFTCGEPV